MAINVAQLQTYMGAGFNILITGEAGTGKTAMLTQAAGNLGMKMKYYSASTIDPWADLIGIPVPNMETKTLEFFRPTDVDDAEVVFLDEINRAETKTLNALFELIQFKRLNGVPLPKLKCVVAAMNPVSDAYDTDELDIALADRFHVYLNAAVELDYQYLKAKFGEHYARAGMNVFRDYQTTYNKDRATGNEMPYLSPRRLDVMMENFRLFPKRATLEASVTPGVILGWTAIADNFLNAIKADEDAKANVAARAKGAAAASRLIPASAGGAAGVEAQMRMTDRDRGRKANASDFMEAYNWASVNAPSDAQNLLTALATSLNKGVGVSTLSSIWNDALAEFSFTQKAMLQHDWPAGKKREVAAAFGW